MSTELKPTDFFVSTAGLDPGSWRSWSGKLPESTADGSDGPFATVEAARDAIRRLKGTGSLTGPITVWIRGGRYVRTHPMTFGPEDSGPVTYAAYPGEEPVFDGGVMIGNWRKAKRNGLDVWTADVSRLLTRSSACRQLFVNGSRRPRARLPKNGFFAIDGSNPATPDASVDWPVNARRPYSFVSRPGDLTAAHSLDQAEIVTLCAWRADRLPVAAFDPEARLVTVRPEGNPAADMDIDVLLRTPHWRDLIMAEEKGRLSPCVYPGLAYYVENVPEALCKPGEWYLDARAGEVCYLPQDGETPGQAEAFVSCVPQLLLVCGDPERGQYVEGLTFRGLAFEHTDWLTPLRSRQAEHNVPGVIRLEGARACAIERCRVEHVGWYGIELADGCRGNRIVGNTLRDVGAGGVKVNGADVAGARGRRTGNNRISDNEIGDGGAVFHSAIGVLLMHSFGNEVSHNHIHDLCYGGVSCGWTWGYGESVSRENRIIKNHIHDIGRCPWKRGLLADLGGIYMLGVQAGTTIRGNVVHDIFGDTFAWGIYLDAGSSHMLIEDNLCWNVDEGFHIHYGRENTVRNNIFALCRHAPVSITRGPQFDYEYAHCGPNAACAFTLTQNILVADGSPFFFLYRPREHERVEDRPFRSDMNLLWDVSGDLPAWGAQGFDVNQPGKGFERTFDTDAWRAIGLDLASVLGDPECADLAGHDFTLAPDSPAFALGFRPIEAADVGPRPA